MGMTYNYLYWNLTSTDPNWPQMTSTDHNWPQLTSSQFSFNFLHNYLRTWRTLWNEWNWPLTLTDHNWPQVTSGQISINFIKHSCMTTSVIPCPFHAQKALKVLLGPIRPLVSSGQLRSRVNFIHSMRFSMPQHSFAVKRTKFDHWSVAVSCGQLRSVMVSLGQESVLVIVCHFPCPKGLFGFIGSNWAAGQWWSVEVRDQFHSFHEVIHVPR